MERKRGLLILAGTVGVAIAAWLAFGFFGVQSLFIDNEVDEAGPVFASGADAAQEAEDDADAEADAATEAEAEANAAAEAEAQAVSEAAGDPVEVDEDMMPGTITTVASGSFTGTSRYDVTGEALVLNDGSEQRFLRFENFESSNGPDLKVYLRAADGQFVNLGDLKGNVGDQNYEIPSDVDLAVFSTVEIWCERFSALFGDAPLA